VGWEAETNKDGKITHYRNTETGEIASPSEYERLDRVKDKSDSLQESTQTREAVQVQNQARVVYTDQKSKGFIDATSAIVSMPTLSMISVIAMIVFIRVKNSLAKK